MAEVPGETPKDVKDEALETYHFPEESSPHEGTWLQWPHHHQYGITHRKRFEQTWIDMTKALQGNENVHIIAYDAEEKKRIIDILEQNAVPLEGIDFRIYPTDDVWVRDNGPIFVKDEEGRVLIEDWGFNGWGGKHDFKKCDKIPQRIGTDLGVKVINLNEKMVIEGGAVEADGNGVLVLCKSSVISQDSNVKAVRNKGMTEQKAEEVLKPYYGVSKVIWLDGRTGLEVTDMHIDGFMKFINHNTMITMNAEDLSDMGLYDKDIDTLYTATNVDGKEYQKVYVPATKNKVKTAYGKQLDEKGSYTNYYVANNVVLLPVYDDPNDEIAYHIIQEQYPNREVVKIDSRNIFGNGGMVHCVTQQQPAGSLMKA